MSGGTFFSLRALGVRALAAGLVAGVLPWPGVSSLSGARASESADASAASRSSADSEKSVIVSAAKKAKQFVDAALATDSAEPASEGDDSLEPIAMVSDNEPELAEPPAQDGQEPTLADDYADVATPGESPKTAGSEKHPTTDDVCIDEPAPAVDEAKTQASEKPHPVIFRGVEPGSTTRAEVLRAWGKPQDEAKSGDYHYELEAFPSVDVAFDGETVDQIKVQLFEPTNADRLAAKLMMGNLRAAKLTDDAGAPIATVFPERGVTLNHRPVTGASLATDETSATKVSSDEAVYEIVASVIRANDFVLRAETAGPRDFTRRAADLETAIELDPKNWTARQHLAELKLSLGEAANAERLASEACDLAPRSDACRLTWARSLRYLARYSQAVEQTQTVIEGTTATKLERAAALLQMGQLAALGDKKVRGRSVPLLNKSIALADPLAVSEDQAERVAAGQLLVDAHLAVAEQIAMGDFQKKDETVAKWVSRASGLAEHMIASGEADVSLRLEVAVSALAASARLEPPVNPELWVKEAEAAAADLQLTTADRAAREQLNWQLGLAYFYAAEIMHRRSQPDDALKFGQLAEATLIPAADARRELPDTDYVLGRLYFQIGAVHAVHYQDHDTACQWYDRAAESLMRPVPLTAQTSPSQHGDALVSMGVSYWQAGARDRAYALTQAGYQLMEQGVKEGLIASDSLDVPRKNMAAMDRALGKTEVAEVESTPSTKGTRVAQVSSKTSAKSSPKSSKISAQSTKATQVAKHSPNGKSSAGKSTGSMKSQQVAKRTVRPKSGSGTQTADRRNASQSESVKRR